MPAHTQTARFHFSRIPESTGGAGSANSFLTSAYAVRCGRKTVRAKWGPNDLETLDRIEGVLADFAQGRSQLADVLWIAPILGVFLTGDGLFKEAIDTPLCIELTADKEAAPLLTNVPWEMTSLLDEELPERPENLLQRLLGKYPLKRLVRGARGTHVADSRLRAFYCISNPTRSDVSTFDAPGFQSAMDVVFRQFSMIEVRASLMQMSGPSVAVALAEIRDFRPHIFVFVGHGDTGDRGSKSPALCFERWVDISEVADCLVSTKRTFLSALICCDLTRENGAGSGAYQLVQKGIPAVLAMQGDIRADFAQTYLGNFLASLLIGYSVPVAAADSRIASGNNTEKVLQSFLPTVFCNERASIDTLESTVGQYRTEMARLAQKIPLRRNYFSRPSLEKSVVDACQSCGLVRVCGGFGCGKTTLLGQVLRRRLADSREVALRPVFYLSCDDSESGRMGLSHVVQQIKKFLREHRALLSDGPSLDEPLTALFWRAVDARGAIVVLDNVSLVVRRDEPGWEAFTAGASDMKKSLLVVVDGGAPDSTDGVAAVTIGRFSEDETRAYVQTYMPRNFKNWRGIHQSTGGLPLFLDSLRITYGNRGLLRLPRLREEAGPDATADGYVKQILRLLLSTEVQTLCNFCLLPSITSMELAAKFLDSTRRGRGLLALKRVGVLRTVAIDGIAYGDVPEVIVQALTRVCTRRVRSAAVLISDRFEAGLPARSAAIPRYVRSIADRPGGLALLGCVQRAYMQRGKLLQATSIPMLAAQGGLASEARWNLFEPVLEEASKAGDSPFLLAAVDLAQSIGKQHEVERILGEIAGEKLTPFYRAKFLKIRAALLKDVGQHEAVPEIKRLYDEAIPLCERGLSGAISDPDAIDADWRELLKELLNNRLNTLAFLEGAPWQLINKDLERLKELEGDSPGFAYSLCSVVEKELRAKERSVDWESVVKKLLEAKSLLKSSNDHRIWTQWFYLYGDYLRQKPEPELKVAAQSYRRAERAGQQAGEQRRVARARLQWVDLEWRSLGELKPDKACELLEEVIPALESQLRDSLSLRVLERICTLRAEIGRTLPQDPTNAFLLKACRVGANSTLRAVPDRRRLIEALGRYLDALKEQQNFVGAQEFVHEFATVLKERLGIEPALNDPWAVRAALSAKSTQMKEV